jgi:hypothetical protein
MISLESALAKAGAQGAKHVARFGAERLKRAALVRGIRPLTATKVLGAFVEGLDAPQARAFAVFTASPQFDHLALQVTTWSLGGQSDEVREELRHNVRLSLHRRVALDEELSLLAADLVVEALISALGQILPPNEQTPRRFAVAVYAEVAAAIARNNELIGRIKTSQRSTPMPTVSASRYRHYGPRCGSTIWNEVRPSRSTRSMCLRR